MSTNSIKKLDITLDEKDIKAGARLILNFIRPKWASEDIKFKTFEGGICNQMVGCYVGDTYEDVVLVRVYGTATNQFTDRERELRHIVYLSNHGLCPPIYATFNNGRAYAYCNGVTLDNHKFKTYRHQIIKEMVRMHSLEPEDTSERPTSEWFDKVDTWLPKIPKSYNDPNLQKRFSEEVPSVSILEKEYKLLKQTVENMDAKVVLCHNDLLWTNIIYDETKDKVTFIDHEFTMYNYLPFEIGDHFAEYVGTENMDPSRYPDKDYQLEWIRIYLEEWNKHNNITSPISDDDVSKLYSQANKFALVANFSWAIWAFIIAEHPDTDFDYLGYGITRMKQYFDKKDEFMAL